MQPPFMLISWGAPKAFVSSLEMITSQSFWKHKHNFFGNKTFVKMLGVIIGGI